MVEGGDSARTKREKEKKKGPLLRTPPLEVHPRKGENF